MLDYTLSDNIRAKMAEDPEAVKAALCVIANQSFAGQHPVRGIGKYQGGIVVNHCEIFIGQDVVMDDWRRATDPTEEERAAVAAINHLAILVNEVGMESIRQTYGTCRIGDPLRSMLNL